MSLFANKNQALQSTPTPATLADIPDDNLRNWWTQVRRAITQQIYSLQNGGIFNAPILTNATIKTVAISEVEVVGTDGTIGKLRVEAGALVYEGPGGTITTLAPS